MGKKKQESLAEWVDAPPAVLHAFEQGAMFGAKHGWRAATSGMSPEKSCHGFGGPSSGLWTINEWREALKNALATYRSYSPVRDVEYFPQSTIFGHPVIIDNKNGCRIFIDQPDGSWHELRHSESGNGYYPKPLTEGVWNYLSTTAKAELGMDLVKPTRMAAEAAMAGK